MKKNLALGAPLVFALFAVVFSSCSAEKSSFNAKNTNVGVASKTALTDENVTGKTQVSTSTPKVGVVISGNNSATPAVFGCELVADKGAVSRGGSVIITLNADARATSVTFNGQIVPVTKKVFTINPTETGTYFAEIKSSDKSASCEVQVKVITTESFDPTDLLCKSGDGAGKHLLAILDYPLENLDEYLTTDLNEIGELTGITSTVSAAGSSDDLETLLQDTKYDAVWYISHSEEGRSKALAPLLKKLRQTGVGIGIFADNSPYLAGANIILPVVLPDWNLTFDGNYAGSLYIGKPGFPTALKGLLYEHKINTGLYQNIFEGITVANILSRGSGKFGLESPNFGKVLQNTNGDLTVATIEEDLVDPTLAKKTAFVKNGRPQSRTLLHGAFTQFYRAPFSTGWPERTPSATRQFVANMACWSVGAK